jgi:FMN-dependent NADH-azoreductase
MPKISITISDYTYWKLLGSGESVSTIVQKALKDYWKESQTQKKITTTTLFPREE